MTFSPCHAALHNIHSKTNGPAGAIQGRAARSSMSQWKSEGYKYPSSFLSLTHPLMLYSLHPPSSGSSLSSAILVRIFPHGLRQTRLRKTEDTRTKKYIPIIRLMTSSIFDVVYNKPGHSLLNPATPVVMMTQQFAPKRNASLNVKRWFTHQHTHQWVLKRKAANVVSSINCAHFKSANELDRELN